MDSELTRILAVPLLILICLAVLILRFTGSNSLYITLGVVFILAIIVSFFAQMLINYGKRESTLDFILCIGAYFIISCASAYFINHLILDKLISVGILSLKNVMSCVAIFGFIFFYSFRFQKYKWYQAINSDKGIHAFKVRIDGVKDSSTMFDSDIIGIPRAAYVFYYSKQEDQMYRGYFKLPKNSISSFIDDLLFPFTGKQEYNRLTTRIKPEGAVVFTLGRLKQEVPILEGKCTPVKKQDLAAFELVYLEEKERRDQKRAKKYSKHNKEGKDIPPIFKEKFSIKHHLTGLVDRINLVRVTTVNGDIYTLEKAFWNGTTVPYSSSPALYIEYHILNMEDKKRIWHYHYDLDDMAKHLENSANRELTYTFDLSLRDTNALVANTYEYIGNDKFEFEVNPQIKHVEN